MVIASRAQRLQASDLGLNIVGLDRLDALYIGSSEVERGVLWHALWKIAGTR
jgi:hypothetical protein